MEYLFGAVWLVASFTVSVLIARFPPAQHAGPWGLATVVFVGLLVFGSEETLTHWVLLLVVLSALAAAPLALALAAAAVWSRYRATRRPPSLEQTGHFKATAWLCPVVFLSGLLAYQGVTRHAHIGTLPPQIEVSGIDSVNIDSGLLESCGAVVFRLDRAFAQSVAEKGDAFFQPGWQARSSSQKAYVYSGWKRTPLTGDEASKWHHGLHCAKLDEHTQAGIEKSLRESKSFYASTRSGGLFVFPELGIAVHAFND